MRATTHVRDGQQLAAAVGYWFAVACGNFRGVCKKSAPSPTKYNKDNDPPEPTHA